MSGTTLRSYHGSNLMPALDHATVGKPCTRASGAAMRMRR